MIRLASVTALLAIGTGCIQIHHTWDKVEQFPIVEADDRVEPRADPAQLRVMTWNIKYGATRYDFFFDGWGDRVTLTEKETLGGMEKLRVLIEEVDPDVLIAQEVDVSSKRTAYIDQGQWLLDHTDFNYMAFVPNWKVDYIPEQGLGRIEMGQAVFSKYPITRNTRIDLPQSPANGALTNYFWLHRAIQIAEVETGARGTVVFSNNHPTAYALDGTKQKHLKEMLKWADKEGAPQVIGGDFNVVPPGTLVLQDFEDEPDSLEGTSGVNKVVYTQEEMDALEPFYEGYEAAIDISDYRVAKTEEEQVPYLSHSISGKVFWTQKLDYLFTTESWNNAWTLQKPGDGVPPIDSDPMTLSDHCPLVGDLVLP